MQQQHTAEPRTQLIKFNAVRRMMGGVSRPTIDAWEAAGHFPKRIKFGDAKSCHAFWDLREVEAFIASRRAAVSGGSQA